MPWREDRRVMRDRRCRNSLLRFRLFAMNINSDKIIGTPNDFASSTVVLQPSKRDGLISAIGSTQQSVDVRQRNHSEIAEILFKATLRDLAS